SGGGQGAKGLLRLRVAVVTGEVEAPVDEGLGRGDPAQAGADGDALGVAVAAVGQGEVVPAAVSVAELPCDARGGRGGDVKRRGRLQVDQVVAAVDRRGVAVAAAAEGRLLGEVVDGAAGGVAPEQGVLRSAQHLDALHVEQPERARVRRVHGDVVHVRA